MYASLRHLPSIWISYSVKPASAAVVAAPLLKECPEKREASKPARVSKLRRLATNAEYWRGEPSLLQNKGEFAGLGSALNKNCRALTAQVGASTEAR